MKKIILILFAGCLMALIFSFNILHSTGIVGSTGSPNEGTCSGNFIHCHGSSLSNKATVSVTSFPALTNNQFIPNTNYTLDISVNHPTLTGFGFGCEILGVGNADAGIMSNPGLGVSFKVDPTNGRKNAVHNIKKIGAGGTSWQFEWMSPALGTATIFISCMAVNGDGTQYGDSEGVNSISLNSANVGIIDNTKNQISQISLFPNPISEFTNLSYQLLSSQKITIWLTDISGKSVKTFLNKHIEAGFHSNILDLQDLSKGVYFVKISLNEKEVSQKLISVN